jgi:hypothetical protein
LAELLRPFVRPTETFGWDLAELTNAGVSAADLQTALKILDRDLVMLIDIILSDATRRGESSRITWHELRTLETLRNAMTCSDRTVSEIDRQG